MNQPRLIVYPLTEVAIDHEQVARNLTLACHRANGHYRITGVCQTSSNACFPCEEVIGAPSMRYVLAPLEAEPIEALAANLHTRWTSGFTTLGMLQFDEVCLGLFAIPADSRQGDTPT